MASLREGRERFVGRALMRGDTAGPFQRVAVSEVQAAMPALMQMAPTLANLEVNGFQVRAETAVAAARAMQKEQRAAKRQAAGNGGWVTEVRPVKAITS
jgi:hypothetical protein